MPELPEVETTRRGIAPYLLGNTISDVIVRNRRLRWPIPSNLKRILRGQSFEQIDRRAKYLLLTMASGTILLHLGMSGRLRILTKNSPAQKHDHVDIVLTNGHRLRFTDPRRFGALLWTEQAPEQHYLLNKLGPEPLSDDFTADYLYQCAKNRRTAVKTLIMDGRIVVGVGNIYACEALFFAGIHPLRAAGRISLKRYQALVNCIRQVLDAAIEQGGTTLRDYLNSTGEPGYFQQHLYVYGRAKQACHRCKQTIQVQRLAQRSTFYCTQCQH